MSSASNPTTGRSEVKVENLKPGMVIYAAPGPLIVSDVLTTQTLKRQQKDKHPLIVLSVDSKAQQITVTYIATFTHRENLVSVPILEPAKKLLLPITPAPQEYDDLKPIEWESHPAPIPHGWASIRSKTVLTGATVRISVCCSQSFIANTLIVL